MSYEVCMEECLQPNIYDHRLLRLSSLLYGQNVNQILLCMTSFHRLKNNNVKEMLLNKSLRKLSDLITGHLLLHRHLRRSGEKSCLHVFFASICWVRIRTIWYTRQVWTIQFLVIIWNWRRNFFVLQAKSLLFFFQKDLLLPAGRNFISTT